MDEFTLFALEAGPDQIYLTARTNGVRDATMSTAENMCAALASYLDSLGMRILHERVFGTLDFYQEYSRIRQKHLHFAGRPFSYIQGMPVHEQGLSGIQIHAVRSDSDENPGVLYDGKYPCGLVWKQNNTTYVHIAGVHGLSNGNLSRIDQASAMFEAMKHLLESQSIDFHDTVRTWIYLDNILEWYDGFNAARTEMFQSLGLISSSTEGSSNGPMYLPASTGIGAGNPAGASCCGDLLAVSGPVKVSVLHGEMQPSAFSYGSAFARGTCIEENGLRQIFVSGTAAIDEMGRSLYPGDAAAQIRKTLDIVEALIGEKGSTFNDLRSATVYLKNAGFAGVYETIMEQRGLTDLPVICIIADICREELLFEFDAVFAMKAPAAIDDPADMTAGGSRRESMI